MAAIANGQALHGGLIPYVATFFVFSDYLKNALRMSALMGLPVIYIMTHDSIGVGRRRTPPTSPSSSCRNARHAQYLHVASGGFQRDGGRLYLGAARKGPSVIALSRQTLPLFEETGPAALKGAYVLKTSATIPQVILIGTGSEVEICYQAAQKLRKRASPRAWSPCPAWKCSKSRTRHTARACCPTPSTAAPSWKRVRPFGWHKYAGPRARSSRWITLAARPGRICTPLSASRRKRRLPRAKASLAK